jgi:hypothetical protein
MTLKGRHRHFIPRPYVQHFVRHAPKDQVWTYDARPDGPGYELRLL